MYQVNKLSTLLCLHDYKCVLTPRMTTSAACVCVACMCVCVTFMARVIPPSARVAARTHPSIVLVTGSVATCSSVRHNAHAHVD